MNTQNPTQNQPPTAAKKETKPNLLEQGVKKKYFARNNRRPLIQLHLMVKHSKRANYFQEQARSWTFQMAPMITVVSACYDLLYNHLGLAAPGR